MKQEIPDLYWRSALTEANTYFKEWDTLFKCEKLEKYYEGKQWPQQEQLNYDPYVINKIYETIQIKLADFLPTFPKFQITPVPSNFEYDPEQAIDSSTIKEDLLGHLIAVPRAHFSEEMEAAYRDHYFRFGIMEVGFASDWITNPNAGKPLQRATTDESPSFKQRVKITKAPKELPVNERVYFKHVKAKRFRIGGFDSKYLERCTWCGYYEFVNMDQLLGITNLMNKDKIFSANFATPHRGFVDPDDKIRYTDKAVKVWHIWHNEAMLRLLLLDSPVHTLFQRKFERLPIFDYRPDPRLLTESFYPIPPVYHWVSPQNETNETREMLRAHRRRFIRKYQVVEGKIDDGEIEKFETGPDGALVTVKEANAIAAIEGASLDSAENMAVQIADDDLNKISGTSTEDRGVADRTTATQAQIVNQRAQIRQTKERDRIVRWYGLIGREALLIARDRFTQGLWIKQASPEGEDYLGTVNDDKPIYKWITTEDLSDGFDFRVDIDLTSMSASASEMEKEAFVNFLSLLTQFPMLAFSPVAVVEAAYRVGYRNRKVIKEFQKQALLMELGRMNQLQAGVQQSGAQLQQMQQQMPNNGNAAQTTVQQMKSPTMDQIQNQLANQFQQGGGG
jgi:hypothetical protein